MTVEPTAEKDVAQALRSHLGNGWTGNEIRCCGQWRKLGEHAEHMARNLLATTVLPPGGGRT